MANQIECGCGHDKDCVIGIRFDEEPTILIFQDKNGEDNIMYLDKENVNELINNLKSIRRKNKWKIQ